MKVKVKTQKILTILNTPADFKCSHNFDDIFKSKRSELIRKYHVWCDRVKNKYI